MELMKQLVLITFTTFFLAINAIAAEKPLKKNEVKGGIVINESLQKLMDIDGVQPIYDKCKTASKDTNKILDCLWSNVKQDAELKKKVETAYADELKAKPDPAARAPASEAKPKTNMTGRSNNVGIDYETDPAVIGLSKYYGEKLDAILDPEKALTAEENKKGLILATNHKQFIELYKSELGKTIINAFTSYCLDTDPDTCKCTEAETKDCKLTCTIDDDVDKRKLHREENIASLKKANLSSDGPDSIRWRACISAVPNACKNPKDVNDETVKRSCLIMDYVESARKNIIAADAQKEFYDDLSKSQTRQIANLSKEIVDPKKVSSDAILEMSSEDVAKSVKEPLEKDKAEFEACFKDGEIVNAKSCEKYLSVNVKDNEMAIAELGMRQMAQEGALENELNSSDAKVVDYLKEEGFTKDQIDNMTSDKTKIKTVKEEIMERYKNQKSAIIAEMAARINAKTASSDGKIEGAGDKSKLEKIRDALAKRSDDLSGLVKFNNIVSSYLEVKKEGSKTNERNTASLFGEIADMKEADKKQANEQVDKAQLKEVKNDNGQSQTNLDVNTINSEFLNYSTQSKDKTK